MFIFKGSCLYLLLYIYIYIYLITALKPLHSKLHFFGTLGRVKLLFTTKSYLRSTCIYVFLFSFFFLSKKQQNWFFKIFHNSGMVELRKPATAPWIVFFISLSICLQYILSFESSDFGLKCLVTVMLKGQSPMVRICLCNIPISEIVNNAIQFLGLLIKMELPWNSKER